MPLKRWQVANSLWRLTLSEWNSRKEQELSDMARRVQHPEDYPNGLVCDSCGGELYDTLQQMSPGRMRVKCRGCGFKGERQE